VGAGLVTKAIRPDQLVDEIMRVLRDYTSDVVDGINVAGDQIAKDGVKELKATSPKDTGDYAKSWRVKRQARPGQLSRFVVHVAAPHYRLTHLLEHGHAKRGGGRVAPKVHIAPVEKTLVDEYVRAVEEAIKRGH
jgi:hypothetical protein